METLREKLDISILQKCPQPDCDMILEIRPLAPLSMVSELPGTYYKTLKYPDKKMLCGLFENILGWHIDLADRKDISKEVKQLREKLAKQQKKQKNTLFGNDTVIPYTDYTKGSTYIPLLMDYFEIQNSYPVFTEIIFYDDLWNRAYRRPDATVHMKGTFNISYEMIKRKKELKRDNKKPAQIDEKELENFFKNNLGSFPLYYSTPTVREYISMQGKYLINMTVDSALRKMLREKLETDNVGYLGNNEGWVDLKIIES
jgi:CRISPR-associated protein Cas5